ncbi:MAG: hypothetical protein V3S04_01020 [Candidatus Omnitrophota bacterium]
MDKFKPNSVIILISLVFLYGCNVTAAEPPVVTIEDGTRNAVGSDPKEWGSGEPILDDGTVPGEIEFTRSDPDEAEEDFRDAAERTDEAYAPGDTRRYDVIMDYRDLDHGVTIENPAPAILSEEDLHD